MKKVEFFQSEDGQIFDNENDCIAWERSKVKIESLYRWFEFQLHDELPSEASSLLLDSHLDPNDLGPVLGMDYPKPNAPKAIKCLLATDALTSWIFEDK